MRKFIGRERELGKLKSRLEMPIASFIVIRGRRRIGKSRLIEEFGKSGPCYLFSGLPPTSETSKQSQLDDFCRQVEKKFQTPKLQVEDWGTMFWHLGQLCAQGRVILALDEISWIGSKDPDFLGQLKNAWDLYFSRNPQLILIVCGSVSSWIEKNILSGAAFVGRISLDLHLEELPVEDAVKFWGKTRKRTSAHEICSLLAVTGGIPRYLEEIKPTLSADQNIRSLCFDEEGLLYREFDAIFSDLFSSTAPLYANVARCLAEGPRTLQEISNRIKKSDTRVSAVLKNLIKAGFITDDPSWSFKTNKYSNLKQYRLSDNYLRFYLKYIFPNRDRIAKQSFESTSLYTLPNWNTIAGLQFENLVLNNVRSLLPMMDLNPSDIVRWGPFFQRPTKRQPGCQVDLLIQTRYRTVFLCEIKFSTNYVGMEAVRQIKATQERVALPRGWSTRLVLIHVNGTTSDVLQSHAFDHIVDFSDLIQEK